MKPLHELSNDYKTTSVVNITMKVTINHFGDFTDEQINERNDHIISNMDYSASYIDKDAVIEQTEIVGIESQKIVL